MDVWTKMSPLTILIRKWKLFKLNIHHWMQNHLRRFCQNLRTTLASTGLQTRRTGRTRSRWWHTTGTDWNKHSRFKKSLQTWSRRWVSPNEKPGWTSTTASWTTRKRRTGKTGLLNRKNATRLSLANKTSTNYSEIGKTTRFPSLPLRLRKC